MDEGRGIYSVAMFHVGASFVSLAPTFFKSQSALTPLLLLSKSQPLALGCDLVSGANLGAGASILFRCSASGQALYRLRRVFSFYSKTHRALILLLLASKSQPLALGCDLGLGMCAGKQRHLYCCDVPARCKRHVACSEFFILKIAACPSACSFLPAGSRPPGPAGGLWLLKEESTHV